MGGGPLKTLFELTEGTVTESSVIVTVTVDDQPQDGPFSSGNEPNLTVQIDVDENGDQITVLEIYTNATTLEALSGDNPLSVSQRTEYLP